MSGFVDGTEKEPGNASDVRRTAGIIYVVFKLLLSKYTKDFLPFFPFPKIILVKTCFYQEALKLYEHALF